MPIPIDARKKPLGVQVYVTTGEGVEIRWSDGHTSRYDFAYLRDHCPCAICNEERLKKQQETAGAANPFPMYKPRVKAKSAAAVGNYAIQIEFSDAHATGIYTFEYLREICPCDICAKEFRNSVQEKSA